MINFKPKDLVVGMQSNINGKTLVITKITKEGIEVMLRDGSSPSYEGLYIYFMFDHKLDMLFLLNAEWKDPNHLNKNENINQK